MASTKWIWTVVAALCFSNCGFYSFSGTSIPEEVKTVSVDFFENNASLVNPLLSQTLTEKLKQKFISETNLQLVESGGDFAFSGDIVGYEVKPAALGAEQAQLNQLKITIQVKLDCELSPDIAFDELFDSFETFDATENLATVESQLVEDITEQLVQRVFNKAAINW